MTPTDPDPVAPVVVAAIMTCHNRRESTLSAIDALVKQATDLVRLRVFLTDDGSQDGTAAAVRADFPETVILAGDGSLFWAAGMALAERAAVETAPDYLLWLNDDTIMDSGSLAVLLATERDYPGSIVVAATRDPVTGALTYGGRIRTGPHPQKLAIAGISATPVQVTALHGNCVLIPWTARQIVGAIDGRFPHAYADDDYGLRATEAGVGIVQAPGTLAVCARNPEVPTPRGLRAGWHHTQSPKGLPWRSQARFLRRHGDWRWPVWLVAGQVRRIVSSLGPGDQQR